MNGIPLDSILFRGYHFRKHNPYASNENSIFCCGKNETNPGAGRDFGGAVEGRLVRNNFQAGNYSFVKGGNNDFA
jgi:hypothetical protein